MCLVEMGMPMKDRATGEPVLDEQGEQKIGWMPKPVIGCGTSVAPGMRVKTESQEVQDCRNGVMEFLLVNHPLDCPICDQAGECGLQEFALDYGRGYSRFVEEKNVKPKRVELGPRVVLDDERCILCSRCIRFCQEVADDDVLGFVDRGSHSTLTCYPGKQLENNYSLNTVDILESALPCRSSPLRTARQRRAPSPSPPRGSSDPGVSQYFLRFFLVSGLSNMFSNDDFLDPKKTLMFAQP